MDIKNSSQLPTKEKVIKRFLIIALGTIVFSIAGIYLGYGKLPDKNFLIVMAIILPLMAVSAIIGYKYHKHLPQILQTKGRFAYFYYIFGGLGFIIINGVLVFLGEKEFNYYLQIALGFFMLFYGIYGIKKLKKNQSSENK